MSGVGVQDQVSDLVSEFLDLCFIRGVSFGFCLCSNSTGGIRAIGGSQ